MKKGMAKKMKGKPKKGAAPAPLSKVGSENALGKVLSERKPKTAKGRRILRKREAQIQEGAKTAMIIRGNRGSMEVMSLLRDLHRLRPGDLSTFYSRKHDEHPFEDAARLETLCNKFDHGLFVFGSSAKKRPFRLILGRLFDKQLLDMQEYNVSNYKPINTFTSLAGKKDALLGAKPMVLFQGPAFETDERLKRTKSLLMDYFRGDKADKILIEGLEHVIVCTAEDSGSASSSAAAAAAAAAAASAGSADGAADKKDDVPPQPPADDDKAAAPPVSVRRFHVQYLKSGGKLPRVELSEVGPTFTLNLDRAQEPNRDRWKMAIKVPKAAKPKKVKNVKTSSIGKTSGQIHLGRQEYDRIHTVHHGKAKEKTHRAELDAQEAKRRRKDLAGGKKKAD